VVSASRSKDSWNATSLPIPIVSTGVQGATWVSVSAPYSGGSVPPAASFAFTPSVYAVTAERSRGEAAAQDRSAARRRPSVRSWTSLGSAPGPSSSASVPEAVRRSVSIWNSRSVPCTQPWAK
jgi:hypothetical protein